MNHGTVRCYERDRCRCDRCCTASRDYRQQLKQRRLDGHGRRKERRYSFDALAQFMGKPKTEIAVETGVTRETLIRWAKSGVPEYSADRLACGIGVHPGAIWHDWYDIELIP